MKLYFMLLLSFYLFGCGNSQKPLAIVQNVDLKRYAGKWYEIARLPTRFEKGCRCVTAEYTIMDKYIEVKNSCTEGAVADAKTRSITGKAFRKERDTSGKLKVQFFWPFKADYWIIALDSDYQYALVGHPNREYLWILSRTPQLDEAIIKNLTGQAKSQGFAIDKLEWTDQEEC